MNLIIILCLCVLATLKVTFQGKFAKNNVKSSFDALTFNMLVFAFSALIYLKDLFSFSLPVLIFATVFGVLTVLFQLFYTKAMSCGNVSLTVLIVNLSMIIPIAISVVFYSETLTVTRLIGICLTILALILSVNFKEKNTTAKKWIYFSIFASLCNGGLAVCQKVFSKSLWNNEINAFVSYSYAVAAVLSIIIFLCLKHKLVLSFKFNYKTILFALIIGIILGVFQALNTKAIAIIAGTLIFPMYYGGSLILSFISSRVILKEKANVQQMLSLAVGIIAIILMNL